MKVLNIKVDGTFSYILPEGEGNSDTSDVRLSAAESQAIQDQINTLQSENFYEMHLEQDSTRAFVHKVGSNNFVVEDNPGAYSVFTTMNDWARSLYAAEE